MDEDPPVVAEEVPPTAEELPDPPRVERAVQVPFNTPVNYTLHAEGLGENGMYTVDSYFRAEEDVNGYPLNSPENVFKVVNLAMAAYGKSKGKLIVGRDEAGQLAELKLTGKTGVRIACILKTVHYNFNSTKRFSYVDGGGERLCSRLGKQRTLFYRFQNYFSKDTYAQDASKAMQSLSQIMRIKVGDQWVSIPERAFGLGAETKGKYDGDLKIVFQFGDETQSAYDCQDPVLRMMNKQGFNIPDWHALVEQEIEAPISRATLVTSAWYTLIVEDGGLFNLFRQVALWKKIPVIVVCPHGKSDNDTVAFVWMLCTTLGTDAYGLCDMNVGGCDVLNGFGDATQTGWDERRRYSTNVRWLALRPSQLDKFKTGNNAKSRKLSSKSFKDAFRFFGPRRQARLDNHLNGKTQWIANSPRADARREEMEALKKLNYGLDTQIIEDDQLVECVVNLFMRIKKGEDNNAKDFCWV